MGLCGPAGDEPRGPIGAPMLAGDLGGGLPVVGQFAMLDAPGGRRAREDGVAGVGAARLHRVGGGLGPGIGGEADTAGVDEQLARREQERARQVAVAAEDQRVRDARYASLDVRRASLHDVATWRYLFE